MSRFFTWLSGANREVLAQCPGETGKYSGMGGVVLTTAVMAAVAAGLAVNLALQANPVLCVLIGLGWGLAIMNLDRWLISAFPRRGTVWKNFLQALPRFVMALIIGVVVSTPLVLRLFDHEISQQIEQDQQHDQATFQRDTVNQYKVTGWQQKVNQDKSNVASTAQSEQVLNAPSVVSQWKSLNATRAELETLRTTGGSTARIAELTARESSQEENYNTAVRTAVADFHAQGGENLPIDEASLNRAKTLQQKSLAEYRSASETNRGLLVRIKALSELRSSNGDLATAYAVLWCFITLIEILPVLLKFLMTLGSPNSYEQALLVYNDHQLARAKMYLAETSKASEEKLTAQSKLHSDEIRMKSEYAEQEMRRRLERAAGRSSGSSRFGP